MIGNDHEKDSAYMSNPHIIFKAHSSPTADHSGRAV
jgi:hypothetical protein